MISMIFFYFFFFFNDTETTEIYTLSLHDALPISQRIHVGGRLRLDVEQLAGTFVIARSEEHTSELQSRFDLVCRLLLDKKKQLVGHEGLNIGGRKNCQRTDPDHDLQVVAQQCPAKNPRALDVLLRK